jgi:hypothetical protein
MKLSERAPAWHGGIVGCAVLFGNTVIFQIEVEFFI